MYFSDCVYSIRVVYFLKRLPIIFSSTSILIACFPVEVAHSTFHVSCMEGANKEGGQKEQELGEWRKEMERGMGEWEKSTNVGRESRKGGKRG